MMSQEKAFDIIEGSGIYSDKMVFLRELIQNAEDASKIQLWRDLQKRPGLYLQPHANADDLFHIQPYDLKPEAFDSYKITVDMKKEPDDRFRIRVIDRGTGMNADTVKQMCNVGVSYQQDKTRRREIESMPAWLRPTAGFGIGLQSIFLVTPAFTMYSRTEKRGIKVTVESRKREGYVQVEEDDSWEKQGTCVEVIIPADQIPISYSSGYEDDIFCSQKEKSNDEYDEFSREVFSCIGGSFFAVDIVKENVLRRAIRSNRVWFCSEESQNKGELLFSKAINGGVDVWDKENCIFFHLGCTPKEERRAFFRGIKIEYSSVLSWFVRGVHLVVDFYGLDAKNYLSINRKDFRTNKLEKIQRMLNRIVCCIIDFLLEQENIKEWMIENVEESFGSSDCYFILWQLADSNQKKRLLSNPKRFLQPMTETVKTLIWTENSHYCEKDTNVGTILENYKK